MARKELQLLVVLCLSILLNSISATNVSYLIPETLADGENSADKYSNVTYKKVKDDYPYNSAKVSDVGSLEAFYGLAQSIISTSLPGEFPLALYRELKKSLVWEDPVKTYLGYIIAVAVGILFIVICPIIGFCFCCCRCCGRCGGGRHIKDPSDVGYEKVCARRTSIIILTVITVMAITGSALMFATNEKLSDSFKNIKDQDVILDDVTAFFDSTINQTKVIVNENFNFTLKVLFRDLDNIGYLLGQPIKEDVIQNSGLEVTYDNIDNMENDAKQLNDSLKILNEEKYTLINAVTNFNTFINGLQTRIDNSASVDPNFATNVPVPARTLNVPFDVSQLPVEINKTVILAVFLKAGISALTQQSRQDLNAIPERIQNETETTRQEVKNKANDYTNQVKDITDNIESIRNDFLGGFDFSTLKKDFRNFMDKGIEYEKYRWYAGIGLACVALLISLLLGLGLICGVCGGNAFTEPTERSACSNHGGNLLTAAIMLFFIFGWLIMLVTTVMFAAGAPTEKFGCGTLNNLYLLDDVISELKLFGSDSGTSWLGNKIYPNKGVNLSIAEVFSDCKSGKSAYTALKMEEGNIFNLSQITDYSKTINIGDQISQFNVGFDGLNITGGDMMNFIDFMSNFESEMNYSGYDAILQNNKVNRSKIFLTDLTTYLANHNATGDYVNLNGIKTDLNTELTSGNGSIAYNSIEKIFQALADIKTVTTLPTTNNLKTRSDNLKSNLTDIEKKLPKITNDTFWQSVNTYESRLRKIFDTFTSEVKQSVEMDLGKCTPLWNIFDSLLIKSVCNSVVGSLNGWWCALGWTIFFLLLSTCTSVVTSKHFFRMQYSDASSSKPLIDTNDDEKVHHFKNQVFHSDSEKW